MSTPDPFDDDFQVLEAKDFSTDLSLDHIDDDVDDEDQQSLLGLTNWFSERVEIIPSLAKSYGKLLVKAGVGSVNRLAKRVSKDPNFLLSIGLKDDDADEIFSVLRNDGLLSDRAKDLEYSGRGHFGHPSLSVPDTHHFSSPINSVQPPTSEVESAQRIRRHRNSQYIKPLSAEVQSEAQTAVDNLRTALEGKMEVAIIGVLGNIATAVSGSSEKQKAYFKVDICPLVTTALIENIGSVLVCEKVLLVMALLCRHSDDVKTSFSLENAKGLANAGACEGIIVALQKHVNESVVLEMGCDAIRCMCIFESNRVLLGAKGACEVVARYLSMPRYSKDAEMCSWICRALGHLANSNEINREKLGVAGACEAVVGAIERHPTNLNVCTEICWAIRNLAPFEGNKTRLDAEFGVEQIVAVMKTHATSEVFTLEACKALVALVADDDDLATIERIIHAGAIPLVLKSMKRHPDSETLGRWVFNLLYYVSVDARGCNRLLSYDILDRVSTTFEVHAWYEGLAEWGCRIIHNIAQIDGTSARMRNAGLCEMVVSCVQRQAISRVVSGVGCLAVGDLAMDLANHSRLSQSGACEAVVGALKRHEVDADVVFQTCHAIHHLSSTENNVGWMGAVGGCEAVTSALSKHTATNINATQYALRALGSLSYKDEGNMRRFGGANACSAVTVALRTHGADGLVAEYSCRAMYHMSGDSNNVSELGKEGACGLVVSALQTHVETASVVTQALLAIYGLAVRMKGDKVHNGNTRKLVSKNAIEHVVDVLRKFPFDAEVQRAGAMAMASLARLDPNRERLGAAGAVGIVLSALAAHASHEGVVAKMAFAVEALSAGNEANRAKFAAGEVVDSLLTAMKKHERSASVVAESLRALITLSHHDASRIKIRLEGSIKLYVKVIRFHETDVKVAKWGCAMVYCCATDDLTRTRLGAAKAPEAVILALVKHAKGNEDVAQLGCKAICSLCMWDSNRVKFNNSDTLSAVVTSLKEHHENLDVAEWACAAIVTLAHHEPNRSKLGAALAPLCTTLAETAKMASGQAHDDAHKLLRRDDTCDIVASVDRSMCFKYN